MLIQSSLLGFSVRRKNNTTIIFIKAINSIYNNDNEAKDLLILNKVSLQRIH
jgi:hypothetical protein